jgi:3,4-dihydroxy 2-butanone 4-phosphate synthase/GTP cyclohydrolase II
MPSLLSSGADRTRSSAVVGPLHTIQSQYIYSMIKSTAVSSRAGCRSLPSLRPTSSSVSGWPGHAGSNRERSSPFSHLPPRMVFTVRGGSEHVSDSAVKAATVYDAPGALTSTVRPLDVPSDGFDSIQDALKALQQGIPVVVLDDEDRENEGDLIVSGDRVTEETMAFIVEYTSGVICLGMQGEDLDRLKIPLMIPPAMNEEAMSTAFTVTVDLREGTTTGISAADRTATIRALSSTESQPDDFKRPGHIFPLRCRPGGVLVRPGHTEASVDLSRLAGCAPAGVLCEIVNKDGTMARTPELLDFSKKFKLPCITIADLIRYRLKHDDIIQRTAEGRVSTRYGTFEAYSYSTIFGDEEHIALVYESDAQEVVDQALAPLARVQNESILGDLFGSERCGSQSQFDEALGRIAGEKRGVFVYVRGQKARGLGIAEELELFHGGAGSAAACSTLSSNDGGGFTSDVRDYAIAAHIFRDLGVSSIRLLTNNDHKADCLSAHGLSLVERIPL